VIHPRAARPIESALAATQVPGIPLLSARYAARDASGKKLFTVSREMAFEGIAAGTFVPVGRTCVKYLRINSAADPPRSERVSAPKTWDGPPNLERVRARSMTTTCLCANPGHSTPRETESALRAVGERRQPFP